MRTRLIAASFIAVALATVTAQNSQSLPDRQDTTSQPVFRAASNFIRVDMYATRGGEFVTDLRPEEIEVLEDGVRQRVETFEFVRIPSGGGVARAGEEEGAPDDGRSRVYVVFIDTNTTQLEHEKALRLSLVRFLDRLLAPDDLVALMTPDMVASDVTLGRRSTVISDVANDARWVEREEPERENLKEFAWENCYPARGGNFARITEMKARRRARQTIGALQDLVTRLRDMREERKAVLFVGAGWTFMAESALQNSSRLESEACEADRLAMLRIDYGNLLRDLGRSANRANVSFYTVNSRRQLDMREIQPRFRNGVGINPAMIRQRDRQIFELSNEPLKELAGDTDGLAENGTDNLDRITDRIIADTSAYYLLGYQSSNTRQDGRFRSISVKVHREGVRVRARPGYGGESPAPPPPPEPVSTGPAIDGRVSLALESVDRFDTAAPVWLRATGAPADGGGAFWFIGEVGTLRATKSWASGGTADVEVLAADRTKVLTRAFDLKQADSAFSGRVPETGTLPAGDYTVRVRLTPSGEDRNAVHESMRVRVEDGASGFGGAILLRRGASSRLDYVQTADPRFRRNERLRLELPTGSTAEVSARILDRMGQPLQLRAQVGERPDAAGAFRWIVVDAPVAGLAPGDYAVEVTQDGVSQVTAFRIVP